MTVENIRTEGPDRFSEAFADAGEVARDLHLLEALREARKSFFDELAEKSAVADEHFVRQLRQEPAYQIAEFFYLLRAFGVTEGPAIRRMAELHNAYLGTISDDREKMRRLGLTPDRVEKGLFSDDSLLKLVENHRFSDGGFDQSDLARLLTTVMSSETCRKIVVTLADAGLLERLRSPYRSMLVRSTGVLEAVFSRHLRLLRFNATAVPLGGTTP